MIPLHEQLRLRRSQLHMTQRGLAITLGLTGAGVSFRERGDSASLRRLDTWAKTLNCDLRLLTEGSSVICKRCREQVHEECPGGTWCDCAHRSTAITPYQVMTVGHPGAGTTTLVGAAAEEEDLREAKISAGVRLMYRLTEPSQAEYHSMFRESLNLLFRDGLQEAIEGRYALDELARETSEVYEVA